MKGLANETVVCWTKEIPCVKTACQAPEVKNKNNRYRTGKTKTAKITHHSISFSKSSNPLKSQNVFVRSIAKWLPSIQSSSIVAIFSLFLVMHMIMPWHSSVVMGVIIIVVIHIPIFPTKPIMLIQPRCTGRTRNLPMKRRTSERPGLTRS